MRGTCKAGRRVAMIAMAVAGLCVAASRAQEVTTVRMTDEVVLEGATRIGMNISGDAYWKPLALKRRLGLNFEGGHITIFGLWTEKAETVGNRLAVMDRKFRAIEDHIEAVKESGTVTWLGEPKMWETAHVVDVVQEDGQAYLVLDEEVPVDPDSRFTPFYLLEALDRDAGRRESLGPLIQGKPKTDVFQIALNDVPPDSHGWRAFRIVAPDSMQRDGWALTTADQMDCTGRWRVSLWAKAAAGRPELSIGIDNTNTSVPLTGRWRKFEKVINVTEPDPESWVSLDFAVRGGTVLLDDIMVTKLDFENPTAFTDSFVRMMRDDLRAGIVRQLIMGGRGVDNYLQGVLRKNPRKVPWTITEYYAMCEYIDAAPWHSLPGVIRPEGMKDMMEYLGAPADVGYGRLRAQQGHPEPWTEVFDRIYIQVSNEPITFNANSPLIETWRSLADAAKSSPYYEDNIQIVASAQDVNTGNWVDWQTNTIHEPAPGIDSIALASYFLGGLWKEDLERHDGPEALFEWLVHLPQHEWDTQQDRWRKRAESAGYDLSVYETSFHTTFGNASSKERNGIITSQGGMMAQLHNLLYPMREFGVRDQCFFTLFQFNFSPGGSFGDKFEGDRVRLWGTVLNNKPGRQRYRPAALGIRTINQVIGGDMVRTVHAGADPELTVHGRWTDTRGKRTKGSSFHVLPDDIEVGRKTHKAIWSYGFAEGDRRGLILMNHDAGNARPVRVEFDGSVAGGKASTWTIANDDLYASNEPEVGEPQVEIEQGEIRGFRSGHEMALPPFGLAVLKWEIE